MKLWRLVTMRFSPRPRRAVQWRFEFGEIICETMSTWEFEDGLRALVSASLPLEHPLTDTNDGLVEIPAGPRRQLEFVLETSANFVAVGERCSRSISSPSPCFALEAQSPEEKEWLSERSGFVGAEIRAIASGKAQVDDETLAEALKDRLDGAALLAEALSHSHPTGRFHELLRLFERAFRSPPGRLTQPLSAFLATARHGFDRDEIAGWLKLRGPATHADSRPGFLLEADVRPVIARMEQAAYDVLLNKAEWRSTSTARRDAWQPSAGTKSTGVDLFLSKGEDVVIGFQVLDPFLSYPADLDVLITDGLPSSWWWSKLA
jgi:hypothetical protein